MTEVCVIGGGPAGLLVTRDLARAGVDVTVLESGTEFEPADRLSRAEVGGDPITALDPVATRTRRPGGNAALWSVKTDRDSDGWIFGVRYGLLTELALGSRPWIDDGNGWPFGPDELDPWYRRAHKLLAIGAFDYADPGPLGRQTDWLDGAHPPALERRGLRFGPRSRILVDVLTEVRNHPRVRVVEGATATGLHQPASGLPVDRLSFRDRSGRPRQLLARAVVLAGGGVENARLLLTSESERGGIGNESDNVGRHFMDHPLFTVGDLRLHDPATLADFTYFDLTRHGIGARHGHVVTGADWCAENESVEIGAAFFPRPAGPVVAAIEQARILARRPRHFATHPRRLLQAARPILAGYRGLPWALDLSLRRKQSLLPGFGRGGWSADPTGLGFTELELVLQCEQMPLRGSRVTLSNQRDEFGVPTPKVTWRLGDRTRESVLAFQRMIVDRVDQAALGTYVPRAGTLNDVNRPTSIAHHLGTTRMSVNPDDGVVDPDCRVHSCPNLFVAGSSVFPVGGYVNPTLTIAALAMRLAATIARTRTPMG